MDEFEKLMAMVTGQAEDALEKCAKEADLKNPRDTEHIKDLMKILHYADGMMTGSSQTAPMDYSRTGGDWRVEGTVGRTDGNSYANGSSYARRGEHWVRGHYSRRRGGSGYSGMTMQDHIDAMMADATTPQEREMVDKFRREIQR